ncbi:MAG: hypothetical protein ABI867_23535 [Kofleriaceae bacterium]
MKTILLVLAVAGCSAPPANHRTHTPAPTPTPDPTPAPTSDLTPDGKHFAAERVYEGDCAPKGSRGGCHTITLRADGTAKNFLFDAAINGTYEIVGGNVLLRGSDSSMPVETLPLSADHATLGSLALKP